jgi:predicted MFS family arabinose efflux permease
MGLMMLAGFSVIPYVALYITANLGMSESFLSIVYLCGGAATFFSAPLIGKLADKYGKPRVFHWLAWLSFVPILITTHWMRVPWWLVLINSTLFFVLVSGRMIPAMAMISGVSAPQARGTFMSLVSSVQMLTSGLAALIAGLIITRNAAGQIEHYNFVGYLALACGLLAVWLGPQLRVAPPVNQ